MSVELKRAILRFVIGISCAVIGVVFRPFWHSDLGQVTFGVLAMLVTTLVAGWGGKGRPFSLRFGLLCGSGLALTFATLMVTHSKYVGWKTKFFDRRLSELNADPKQ